MHISLDLAVQIHLSIDIQIKNTCVHVFNMYVCYCMLMSCDMLIHNTCVHVFNMYVRYCMLM